MEKTEPPKDSREGRLHDVDTDRGTFRFKDNRKEEAYEPK